MLSPRYQECLAEGVKFERFVYDQLERWQGIKLVRPRWDAATQRQRGENLAGWEIKYDRKFRATRQFFIETTERPSTSANWISAGIDHHAINNLVIGDYAGFAVVAASTLNEARRFCVSKETPTARGFVIEVGKLKKLSLVVVGDIVSKSPETLL